MADTSFKQTVEGTLVGAVARSYQGFNDPQGQRRPGGGTYWAYVSTGFESAPTEIKVTDPADFAKLQSIGFGDDVTADCDVRARNQRGNAVLVLTLSDVALTRDLSGSSSGQRRTKAAA